MIKKTNNFFINSIVFDENPIRIIEQYKINNLFFDEILILLVNFINDYNDMQMLDNYMVQNIYEIISYIKYHYDYNSVEDRKNKINIYNNLITKLNNNFNTNSEIFYINQYLSRGINSDYNYTFSEFFVPEELKKIVRISLCYDNFFYEILNKQRKNISESEFSILVMNSLFIYSVNYFYLECPSILENNSILKEVLIKNKKILNSPFIKNKTDSQSLKKYSKKLFNKIRWS